MKNVELVRIEDTHWQRNAGGDRESEREPDGAFFEDGALIAAKKAQKAQKLIRRCFLTADHSDYRRFFMERD
ncbi:MAG: hypothetical protein ACI9R3_005434 [Verrucomicrobiales bacterium]|jgi:hypothetical protein